MNSTIRSMTFGAMGILGTIGGNAVANEAPPPNALPDHSLSSVGEAQLEAQAKAGLDAQSELGHRRAERQNALIAMEHRIEPGTQEVRAVLDQARKTIAKQLSCDSTDPQAMTQAADAQFLAFAKAKNPDAKLILEGKTLKGPSITRTETLSSGGLGSDRTFTRTDEDRTTPFGGLYTRMHKAFGGDRYVTAGGQQGIATELTMPKNACDVHQLSMIIADGKIYVGYTGTNLEDPAHLQRRLVGPIANAPASLDTKSPPEKGVSGYDLAQAAAPMIGGPSEAY